MARITRVRGSDSMPALPRSDWNISLRLFSVDAASELLHVELRVLLLESRDRVLALDHVDAGIDVGSRDLEIDEHGMPVLGDRAAAIDGRLHVGDVLGRLQVGGRLADDLLKLGVGRGQILALDQRDLLGGPEAGVREGALSLL